ncbi:MAG: flavoprotein, partial [Clostridia bacterium]|nr:flavoprotein [Clostridia bacterium]
MKCVVLGVTGGIAAYKACDIANRLKKNGLSVVVVMTKNAREFVSGVTFETLTGNRAYTDQFDRAFEIGHISLAKRADLMLVAPATANIIGKMDAGIADDLLSTTLMAMAVPVIMAPAMNCNMWKSPANQANIATLKSRGVEFIGPEKGHL